MAAPAPENATIAAAAMASLILFIGSSPKLTPARACSITACPAVRFRFAGGFCSADKRHGRPVHYGKNRPRHGDVILTFVPTSVTCRVPAHSRTPFAKVFGNAERVRWPRREDTARPRPARASCLPILRSAREVLTGLGQAKAGNTRTDRVPGSMA